MLYEVITHPRKADGAAADGLFENRLEGSDFLTGPFILQPIRQVREEWKFTVLEELHVRRLPGAGRSSLLPSLQRSRHPPTGCPEVLRGAPRWRNNFV